MGRPANKDKFGTTAGKVRVSRYRFTGGVEATNTAGTVGSVVAQKGTRKFRVTDGVSTENLALVDDAGGGLLEGQCAIDAVLNDSSIVQVTKLKNRTITYDDNIQIQYTIGDFGDDGDNGSDIAIVDGI